MSCHAIAVADKVCRGAPGVMRQCLEAPYSIDASDRFVRGQRSTRYRTERRTAMVAAQHAKFFGAAFQLGKELPG